jgi:hypothetical protein
MLPQVARVNADLSYPVVVVVVDAADDDDHHGVALLGHRIILLQLSARISLYGQSQHFVVIAGDVRVRRRLHRRIRRTKLLYI